MSILESSIRKYGGLIFGRKARLHRIPFGPNKGKRIFMSFGISPRMYFGIDEPWLAKLSRRYIQQGDVVYDVGAHIGYTCLLFAQRIGSTGEIHAFEIIPSVANQYLKRTMQANNLNNVVVHDVGLASKDENKELSIGESLMTSLHYTYRTPKFEACTVRALDSFASKNSIPAPNLIKIDVEGGEIDCLLGGLELVKRYLPILIIEFHSKNLLAEGFSLLAPLGYICTTQDGTIVNPSTLTRLNQFHASVLCRPKK
jgi:FkbM family methyltransferase